VEDYRLLVEVLRREIEAHKARLNFMACFVMALIQTRTVNLAQIALGLNPMVEPGSNYRWCQWLMREVSFEEDGIGQVILRLLPPREADPVYRPYRVGVW